MVLNYHTIPNFGYLTSITWKWLSLTLSGLFPKTNLVRRLPLTTSRIGDCEETGCLTDRSTVWQHRYSVNELNWQSDRKQETWRRILQTNGACGENSPCRWRRFYVTGSEWRRSHNILILRVNVADFTLQVSEQGSSVDTELMSSDRTSEVWLDSQSPSSCH